MGSAHGVNHPQPSSSGFDNESVSRSGSIDLVHFFIKSANDTQIEVTANLTEKIQDIKTRYFAEELTQSKRVRLIFMGRVLENDAATLRECGIFDRCVAHSVINSSQPSGENGNEDPSTEPRSGRGIEGTPRLPENVFFKTMGIVLICFWLLYFVVGKELFTHVFLLCLVILTIVFILVTICAVLMTIFVILLDLTYYQLGPQPFTQQTLIFIAALNGLIVFSLIIVAILDSILYNLWSIYFTTEQMYFTHSSIVSVTIFIFIYPILCILHFFRFLNTIDL